MHSSLATTDSTLASILGTTVDLISCGTLLVDFLKGCGIPLSDRFDQIKPSFGRLAFQQIEHLEIEGIRAKLFCWASLGTTSIAEGTPHIQVRLLYLPVVRLC